MRAPASTSASDAGARLEAEAEGARTRTRVAPAGEAAALTRNLQGEGNAKNGTGGVAGVDGVKMPPRGRGGCREAVPLGATTEEVMTTGATR